MLLIEIALAAVAWRKGWRWRSLLPIGIGLGVAFLMGAAIGASGGNVNDAAPLGFLVEIGILVSLIVLALRAPSRRVAAAPVSDGSPAPLSLSVKAEGHV